MPVELIADIALDVPGRDAYSYRVPAAMADLRPGDGVIAPFAGRMLHGYAVEVSEREPPSGVALKDLRAKAHIRLPGHLLRLIRWGAHYYRCALGEFLTAAVPAAARGGAQAEATVTVAAVAGFAGDLTRRQREVFDRIVAAPPGLLLPDLLEATGTDRALVARLEKAGAVVVTAVRAIQEVRLESREEAHALTDEQQAAFAAIAATLPGADGGAPAAERKPFLLYGITGSGKTLVYLELAAKVIASGRQVLLLLPEIGLTPQLAARVRRRIARVAVWHSGFTEGERGELWRAVAAGQYDLVLGTRSALFAPLPAPGLIIVDEEHDQSYKQESVPRYHARDLAVVYAGQLGVPVVLGSATPSLESVFNSRARRYQALSLLKRPLGGKLPVPVLVDMRLECQAQRKQAMLSRELITRLEGVRDRREQAIVLLNRRGWAPIVTCTACGTAMGCDQCDISLTWHREAAKLRCHYCGAERARPRACPACGEEALSTFGLGTEQLESMLADAVGGLRLLRVDADTVATRQGHAKLFQAFAEGAADCLVGTQMVAKGLDFPRVTVVGILNADRGLAVPDFRAAERTYQLIAQVAGRAGRGERPGTVVVQAFDINAEALRCAIDHRPRAFVDAELAIREQYGYPPHAGLIRWMWSGEDLAKVEHAATADGARLRAVLDGAVLLGPNPAGLAWLKGRHRWHALVKAGTRGAAQALLDRLEAAGGLPRQNGVVTAVDVDPYVTS
jgi:primosomal protein N' (replication factor Y)